MNRKIKSSFIILAVTVCLTACGANDGEETSKQNTETMPQTDVQEEPEKESEEASYGELTEQELADYSEYFSSRDCYGFLLSSYDDVRHVNLGEVFYSGAGVSVQPDEEEKEAYLQAAGQEELYTDLFYIPADKVNEVLVDKTGYTLEEMQSVGNDLDMLYLEESDAYFAEVGDTNYLQITCTSGTENGDGTVTLECESGTGEEGDEYEAALKCTVTLKEDSRQFISNVITEGYYQ